MIGKYPRKAKYTGITARLIAEDSTYISPSYTRDYPFITCTGIGREVCDIDGNWFLDFGAGIAVTSTGHCHPKVVRAIKNQAGQLVHMSGTDFYYRRQIDLAKKLSEISGLKEGMVFFGNSGAEAVEAAMKLARFYTRRPGFIAFTGAFHGRTMGAMSLTASKAVQRSHYLPLQPVAHVPYPDCAHCIFDKDVQDCERNSCTCVDYIQDQVLDRGVMPASDCAALVMEPIQGEGGYIVPPKCWYKDIDALAGKNDFLIICDEVQAGMGRTGKWFAHHNFDISTGFGNPMTFRPDIITFAKGVASGMPLGGIIAEAEIMKQWTYGSHASTFGGNPISCAAALATITVIEEEGLLENAVEMGKLLDTLLYENLVKKYNLCVNNRGIGLMRAIDLDQKRDAVLMRCFEKGLILLGCGKNGIRFCPALNVTKEEICTCVEILADTIAEVT